MISHLALFPLPAVVFPGEILPLHIFEERYKQLIQDCEYEGSTFGIPAFIDQKLKYGTEMQLVKVMQQYASGAKDILCRGLRVFKIRDFEQQTGGKIYAGGDVEFLADIDDASEEAKQQLLQLIYELYFHLEVPEPKIDEAAFNSYTLAHKIGLSLEQEYTLLQLSSEKRRQDFLINHLLISIPLVQEMNRTKQVIELNGQFKNFDPLDFTDFKMSDLD